MGSFGAGEFDSWADDYDESVRSTSTFPFGGYDEVLNGIVEKAAAEPHSHILDLGVGTGNLARLFHDLGTRVRGVDFSSRMLEKAKVKVPGIPLIKADIAGAWPEELPQTYDRIVSAYVFHHFDRNEKVALLIRLARDLLAPEGRIVIGDISFMSAVAMQQSRNRWKNLWDDEHYWVAEEIIPVCEAAGFNIEYEQVSEFAGIFVFQSL